MAAYHPLKVNRIYRETPESVSISLEIPEDLKETYRFIPGQYLTFKKQFDGTEIRRSYSICSAPYESELRVGIKKLPGGLFSSFANDVLKEGDELETGEPKGRFVLQVEPDATRHFVAFAAGSGITPILSMIKDVLRNEPKSRFTLFYGNRQTGSVIFREEIEALKNRHIERFSVHHVMTGEDLGSELMTGRMDKEKIGCFVGKLFDPKEVDGFYLCGPEQMIHAASDVLQESGVEKERIHFELFTSGAKTEAPVETKNVVTPKPTDGTDACKVKIVLDGDEFELDMVADGKTVLDAAEDAGLDVPYSCKGAVCCTCLARVKNGKAEMEKNYSLTDKEVEEGLILTCQAHPRSASVTFDYDDVW